MGFWGFLGRGDLGSWGGGRRGEEGKRGGVYLYWLDDLSQAGTPLSSAVTPPPSRKLIETAFYPFLLVFLPFFSFFFLGLRTKGGRDLKRSPLADYSISKSH